MRKLILSTAYFPPVSYFRLMGGAEKICIEYHENYIKQTYRNRCEIPSSNGILSLTVPVKEGSFHKKAISELEVDYSKEWVRTHLRALKAAYNSSAFYEFYIDDIASILNSGQRFLVDLNMKLVKKLFELTGLEKEIFFTDSYIRTYPDGTDFRYSIYPGNRVNRDSLADNIYFQVFSDRHGFIRDMSILDLLFNMGPESWTFLKNSPE